MRQTSQIMVLLVATVAVVSTAGTAAAEIPETVTIGGVFDITGWAPHGDEAKFAAEVAVQDFNDYLETIGAGWSIKMLSEDAQAKPETARQKVTAFKGQNVNLLVGMGWSSHITLSKAYIDSNNMLAISHASQAADLSVPDSIFRLVPNDNNQAPAINAMMERGNIEVLLPVIIDDAWGNGLLNGISDLFSGTVEDAIKYSAEATDLSAEAGFVDGKIGELIDEYGAEKIGVLYVGTEEFELLIESMRFYDNPSQVRWFSTNSQAKSTTLVENPSALKFAQDTRLEATRSVSESNSIKGYLDEVIREEYNREPSTYSYPAYDSVWLLGLTILHAQTTDASILTEILPMVARHSYGAVGHLELNEGGDLANSAFEVWTIINGEWVQNGTYDQVAQTLN